LTSLVNEKGKMRKSKKKDAKRRKRNVTFALARR